MRIVFLQEQVPDTWVIHQRVVSGGPVSVTTATGSRLQATNRAVEADVFPLIAGFSRIAVASTSRVFPRNSASQFSGSLLLRFSPAAELKASAPTPFYPLHSGASSTLVRFAVHSCWPSMRSIQSYCQLRCCNVVS